MAAVPEARRAALRVRYAEPHRAYHGQAHIDAMLAALPSLELHGPVAVEVATWYHDAIYDPAAGDNEARSADLLLAEMEGEADPDMLRKAATMIRATASHTLPGGMTPGQEADCAAFLDLDLSILGAAPALYDAYEAGIAAEYVPVHGPAAFRRGRAAFLRATLARPRLFLTDKAHAALDTPARNNLRRTVAHHAQSAPGSHAWARGL